MRYPFLVLLIALAIPAEPNWQVGGLWYPWWEGMRDILYFGDSHHPLTVTTRKLLTSTDYRCM